MNPRLRRRVASCLIGIVLATVLWVNAGNINPPVGPVTGTMKTLAEVEPRTAINATNTPGDADSLFKITLPGSYYLTGNITGVAGKHGVEIAASGVTLDLNGYDLAGVPAMGAFDGVSVTVNFLTNIAVVNGSVRNWGDKGVDLGGTATNCRVADLAVSGNAASGIKTSISCTVSNCSASSNTGYGISAGSGSTVSNCSAYNNSGGINADFGCTITNCSAYQNTGRGITTDVGSTVADCTAHLNTLDGIVCISAGVIRGNTCSSNGLGAGDGAGIHATGAGNRIEGNNCIQADRGIDVDLAGNFISRNICSGNATNWDIVAGNVCLVVLSVPSAAILGDAGGAAPGAADPNANFTY